MWKLKPLLSTAALFCEHLGGDKMCSLHSSQLHVRSFVQMLETDQKADGTTDAINTSIVIESSSCYLK